MEANGTAMVATAQEQMSAVMESVVVNGDVSKLDASQRTEYYLQLCKSLNLNPLTRPFAIINLNKRDTMYALRDCTDQLRKRDRVSVRIISRDQIGDVYAVTAQATLPDGRTDESIGAVPTAGLKSDALANALMKAETKAKRRVTLSICGLGMLDETELETIPEARQSGERRKLTAEPETKGAEELTLDEQRKKWMELFDACKTTEDIAKVNALITKQGYAKDFKALLKPAYEAAVARIVEAK